MMGTAIRVLPKVIGLRLCDFALKGDDLTWDTVYDFVRCAERYIEMPLIQSAETNK